VTFKWLFKVKPMLLSYGSLETIQLLFETFFRNFHIFRDICLGRLKWNTLYISLSIFYEFRLFSLKLLRIIRYRREKRVLVDKCICFSVATEKSLSVNYFLFSSVDTHSLRRETSWEEKRRIKLRLKGQRLLDKVDTDRVKPYLSCASSVCQLLCVALYRYYYRGSHLAATCVQRDYNSVYDCACNSIAELKSVCDYNRENCRQDTIDGSFIGGKKKFARTISSIPHDYMEIHIKRVSCAAI